MDSPSLPTSVVYGDLQAFRKRQNPVRHGPGIGMAEQFRRG